MARDSNIDWSNLPAHGVLSGGRCTCDICQSSYLDAVGGDDVGDDSLLEGQTWTAVIQPVTPRGDVLPTDRAERKTFPICTGCLDYFPDAIAAIAHLSWVGNQQHNPGEPLHWAREKSSDQEDTMLRHFIDRGKIDEDGERHTTKAAWRLLAILQLELEAAAKG